MTTNTSNGIQIQPGLDQLISLRDASILSGLSSDHLRRLAEQGKIWAKKIGRNWVTTEHSVKSYLSHNRKPGRQKTVD